MTGALDPLQALLQAVHGALAPGDPRIQPGPPVRDPETGHTWIEIGTDGGWLMIPAGVELS